MAMKGYFSFPKAPALLEPYSYIVKCDIQDTCCRVASYTSVEMQLVYSTASADWVNKQFYVIHKWSHNKYYHSAGFS